jgi:oligosaccharyltransferase complex subunit alpha (ribophorin I)
VQSTRVLLPTGRVESYTEEGASLDRAKKVLKYGPFSNERAYSRRGVRVHFETREAIAVFAESEREFTVSHWGGKVAVEEHFELQNRGAELSEGFARVDYQAPSRQEGNSFRYLTGALPLGARDVFYRDIIGNISTSHVRQDADKGQTVLEVYPRFPLFGGWKTVWNQGYDLSTDRCLQVDSKTGEYVLRLPAGIPFDKFAVELLRLRFVLPEAAYDISVTFDGPFRHAVVATNESTRFTFLDAPNVGRPVRVVEAVNVVANHASDAVVRYKLPALVLWREPFLFTAAIFAAFFLYNVLARIDLSVS